MIQLYRATMRLSVSRKTVIHVSRQIRHAKRYTSTLSEITSTTSHFDSYFYMRRFQLCIERVASSFGHQVHGSIIVNGFGSGLHLINKAIIFYAKINETVYARKVFDRMLDRNVVTWTAMISCYTQSGHCRDSLLMFLDMHRAGVRANQFTYGSVLRACTGLKCFYDGLQIHGCVEKSRFSGNLYVQSALLDFHCKCGNMEDAFLLFGSMSEKDVVSWNSMIGGFAIRGFGDDSFRMFRLMMRDGMFLDNITLGSVLKAVYGANDLVKVTVIHGYIVCLGFESNISLIGSLVDAYVKCGNISYGCLLYKTMPKKNAIPFTILIAGCARDGYLSSNALNLFKEIQCKEMEVDDFVLSSMVNICANMALPSMGRQVHAFALKYKPIYDVAVGNALIDMYSKSGEIKDATLAFDEIVDKNVISWTSLIRGYGMHGRGHEALALCKKMEHEGLQPNDITFLSLLFACSHCGLINEGQKTFNDMINKYNFLPRSEHFSCFVDLFARGGRLEEAHEVIKKINIKPDASIWGAIVGSCNIYGSLSLGEEAAKRLLKMDPTNSVNYVVLSNIYSAAGAWDNALTTRNLMKNRSFKKASGYSHVDIRNSNTQFLG